MLLGPNIASQLLAVTFLASLSRILLEAGVLWVTINCLNMLLDIRLILVERWLDAVADDFSMVIDYGII